MNAEALGKRLTAGEILLVGEYRGTSVDKIEYVDKTDGTAKSFIRIAHLVEKLETGRLESVFVIQPTPVDLKEPEQFKTVLKKGVKYAFSIRTLTITRGRFEAKMGYGEIVPVE